MTDDGKKESHLPTSHDNSGSRTTQFLANERTFLAWLRTCIAIIGLGFVVARFSLFLREFGFIMTREGNNAATSTQQQDLVSVHSPSSILGLGMVALGVILAAFAFYNYKRAHRTIEGGGAYVSRHSIMYVATIGLIAFGVIVIVYLFLVSAA
jgi:putative membrane protein